MKLSSQQALLSARNTAKLIASGGRVSPRHIGEDYSDRLDVWDCRNATLVNGVYKHHTLTTLNTHAKPKGAWTEVEREMVKVYHAYAEMRDAERRLEELQAEDSQAHPEGVLRAAYKVDRLREVYEAAEAACDSSKEAIGWELFQPPRMIYSWML